MDHVLDDRYDGTGCLMSSIDAFCDEAHRLLGRGDADGRAWTTHSINHAYEATRTQKKRLTENYKVVIPAARIAEAHRGNTGTPFLAFP